MNEIICGDARELSKDIPDNSIDLIFTDPPYPRAYLHLYEWLGEEAARVLKPGGMLFTYSGQYHLQTVMQSLGKHLTYHWMYVSLNNGGNPLLVVKKIFCSYKPIVAYSKGLATIHGYSFDVIRATGGDKRFHKWGQPESTASLFIAKYSQPEALIWEPFCGGGTVPYVCKQLHRNFIAYEIDSDTAIIARERLKTVQPLLMPEHEEVQPVLWEVSA